MGKQSMKQRWYRVVRAVLWFGVLVVGVSPVYAAYQELDGIIAIVDDDVVLASELLSRLESVRKQMVDAKVTPPPDNVILSQLMERLVIESIQLQQAERRGVNIDDESLTRAVATFAQQNQMSIDQFREALARDGVDYREFREDIRKEMIIGRLQRNMVNRRIVIGEKDIDDMIGSPYIQQLLSDEFRVGHILLAIEEDASDSTILEAEAAALQIVQELRNGANFQETAIARSAGARALEGGDLGWRRAGELPSLFADQVLALEPGETSEPIRSGSGLHIVQLLEQRGAGMQREQQTLVSHILVQPSQIRSERQTERLIRDIHQQLEDGAEFESLAKEHSQDPGSALNGGDLGWSTGEEFVETFRNMLLTTPTGSISEPFQSEFGWHVLNVRERREQDMSKDARRNMVLKVLHQRRYDEELEEWLKEIRDEAFVEIRMNQS